MPGILPRLAQYELTLLDWVEANTRARAEYVVLGQQVLARVPDGVRLCALLCQQPPDRHGLLPVACEVDIYGALSEYIGTCVTGAAGHAAGHQQHRARRYVRSSPSRASIDYRQQRDLHGLPLRQHADVPPGEGRDELSADHEPRPGARTASRTSPAARWKATSCPATSPSSACRATRTASCRPTSRRARCCRWTTQSLRRHRRVRHSGNEPLLPPCADRRAAIRITAR